MIMEGYGKLSHIIIMIICFILQPEVKAEVKRKEACTRIRLKIFPYFLKARESGNAVPYNILVSTDLSLYTSKEDSHYRKIISLKKRWLLSLQRAKFFLKSSLHWRRYMYSPTRKTDTTVFIRL